MSGTIVAFGAGRTLFADPDNRIHDYLLGLTGKEKPRIGFLPTASGDDRNYIKDFYKSYPDSKCEPDVLKLFYRDIIDLESWFEQQDIITVGGGNTANMLAVWRIHGVDELLLKAWCDGKVLCGGSAGGLCWFEEGITDSFSPDNLQPLNDGLGFLNGSFCPHYDSNPMRSVVYDRAIRDKRLQDGYAADNFTGLVFRGKEFSHAISPDNSRAYRVCLTETHNPETTELSVEGI